MYTYIIKSHDLYKIGRSNNVENRVSNFKIGNPYIEIVKVIEGDYELALHTNYKDKRVTGEWFKLDPEDISDIDSVIKVHNPVSYCPANKIVNNIPTKEKCPCEDKFMLSLLALGIMSCPNVHELWIKGREMNNFQYEIWLDHVFLDSCKSGNNIDFMKLTVSGFDSELFLQVEHKSIS